MIPRSGRWESMGLLFVECPSMPSVFLGDHLFKGLFRMVHSFLGQFRRCCGFAEYGVGPFFLVYFFPLFFCCNDRCLRTSWLDARYYYWLALFVQGCVFPVNDGFESR